MAVPAAHAEPVATRTPAMRPMDDRGFLGSMADSVAGVADRGEQFLGEVGERASSLVESAVNVLGVRYRRGGSSAESGFDCSGFTRYVFENSIGRVLPHRADEQANAPELVKVDKKDLKPGDLVFFDTLRRTFSHVGIYLGDGKFIHSPRAGETVRIEDMNISYWARRFTGARRVPELDAGAGAALARQIEAAPQGSGARLVVASSLAGLPGTAGGSNTGAATTVAQPAPATLVLAGRDAPGFVPRLQPFAAPFGER